MSTNTGDNRKPGTFSKGDPRINRGGRPKSFDALRELAIRIASEEATAKGEPIVIDGHKVTNAEMIMRQWMKDPRNQEKFIHYAFGKVPDNLDVTSAGEKIQAVTVIEIVKTDERTV
jgi:hypothetical protein